MSIVITGASGQLGRRVAELVLEQTSDVILVTRTPEKLSGLGGEVRRADFDDPASLDAAFAGGSRLLLVSLPTIGARVPQHIAAIDAAARAGVGSSPTRRSSIRDRRTLRRSRPSISRPRRRSGRAGSRGRSCATASTPTCSRAAPRPRWPPVSW